MEFVGVGSIFIVLLTGLFTGAVFALQGAGAFRMFNAESLVGPPWVYRCEGIVTVLTGLMVTGRAGSGIATELGTMRVTEQIDALYTMAVNPVQYLIVPRVIAGLVMVPILSVLFTLVDGWMLFRRRCLAQYRPGYLYQQGAVVCAIRKI